MKKKNQKRVADGLSLAAYLKEQGRGAVAELVRRSGVSRSTVERAAAGAAVTADVAKRLVRGSGGKVSARKLVGL